MGFGESSPAAAPGWTAASRDGFQTTGYLFVPAPSGCPLGSGTPSRTGPFNVDLSHDEISQKYPVIMNTVRHFDARSTRDYLLKRGGPAETGFIKFAYRPFDTRWLYWEGETKLLNDKRAEFKSHVFEGNAWIEARQRQVKEDFSLGTLVRHFAGDFGNGLSHFVPLWLRDEGLGLDNGGTQRRPNMSAAA